MKVKLEKWGFTCGTMNVDQNQTLQSNFGSGTLSGYTNMNASLGNSGFRICVSNVGSFRSLSYFILTLSF